MTYQIQYDNLILSQGDTPGEALRFLRDAGNTRPEFEHDHETGSIYVYICNDFWINKKSKIKHSYSMEYCIADIYEDLAYTVCQKHGYKLVKIIGKGEGIL
jgi:hypothetical protein